MNNVMIAARAKWVALVFVSVAQATGLAARGADRASTVDPLAARAELPLLVQEPKPKSERVLTLQVLDKTDSSPLRGAVVWVRSMGGRTHTWEGMTEDEGGCVVVPPDGATQGFDIVIAADGYTTAHGSAGLNGNAVFPVKLERAVAIGGLVRDGEGRPIAGARVFPVIYRFSRVWPEIYASPNSDRAIATTDDHGRWRSAALPTWMLGRDIFGVQVSHPEYVTCTFPSTAADARAFSSVQVMKPGVAISGTVLSPFGRPVREATVVASVPPRDGVFLRLTTDKDGKFRSSRCVDAGRPGLVLLVQAPGLAWAVHHVAAKGTGIPEQLIRLSRRRALEGRVVDGMGKAIAGAFVWSSRDVYGGLIEWQAETDANGQFVWQEAPIVGKLYLDILQPPFLRDSKILERPENGEITITLQGRR